MGDRDAVLAGVFRRLLEKREGIMTNGPVSDLCLMVDGYVDLTPAEGEVVWELLHG